MKSNQTTTPKRPFNLTLSEANVERARAFTGNLSATVDSFLADFVARETAARRDRQKLRDEVCEALNRFNAVHGSFADEHSTLLADHGDTALDEKCSLALMDSHPAPL